MDFLVALIVIVVLVGRVQVSAEYLTHHGPTVDIVIEKSEFEVEDTTCQ